MKPALIVSFLLVSITSKAQIEVNFLCGKWDIHKTASVDQPNSFIMAGKPYSYDFLKDSTYVFNAASGWEFKEKWYLKKGNEIHLIENSKPKTGKYNYTCVDDETVFIIMKISQDSLILREDQAIYYFGRSKGR